MKDRKPVFAVPHSTENDLQRLQFEALLHRALHGDRRALADVLTQLEVGGADLASLMAVLEPHLNHPSAKGATVLGFTGPPGAGKSTLVNSLIKPLRAMGRRVAIIAVDPSSPVSGGAILGDRVRMVAATNDDGVFIRSLASRGALGGLSAAAVRLVDGLDAVGYDPIIIETVGTGQNEIDVAAIADVRVVLAAPNLGDGIQAMKAGLLEIADILVVNKADLPGADATMEQLKAAQMLGSHADARLAPVLKTTSINSVGVVELISAIDAHAARVDAATPRPTRRLARINFVIEATVRERVSRALIQGAVSPNLVTRVARGEESLTNAVDATLRTLIQDQARQRQSND